MPVLQPDITKLGDGTDLYEPVGQGVSNLVIASGQATIPNGASFVQVSMPADYNSSDCIPVATGRYLVAGNPGYFAISRGSSSIMIFYRNPATGGPLSALQNTPVFYSVIKSA